MLKSAIKETDLEKIDIILVKNILEIGIQDDYVKIQDISDHQIMPLKHFIEYMEQEDEVSEL